MSYSKSLNELAIKIAEEGIDDIKVPAKLIIKALKLERAGNSEAATEVYVLSCRDSMVEADLQLFQKDIDKNYHKIGCKKSAQVKRKNVDDRYAGWQDEAEMIWAKNPHKSVLQVSVEISESEFNNSDYKVSPNTIRKIIKKQK